MTKEGLDSIKEEIEEIVQGFGDADKSIDLLWKQSTLDFTLDPWYTLTNDQQRKDISSILFDLGTASRSEKATYSGTWLHDLQVRDMWSIKGNVDVTQKRLLDVLKQEFWMRQLEDKIRHGTVSEHTTFYHIMNAIPCSLYMENRIGLKICTRLLRIGSDNAKDGKLGYIDCAMEAPCIKCFWQ
jgi:hypothetical protein